MANLSTNFTETEFCGVPIYNYVDGPLAGCYTVEFAGDEVIFNTEWEAQNFIEESVLSTLVA